MTLLEEIQTRAAADPTFAAALAAGDHTACAAALSVNRTRLRSVLLTERGVMAALGVVDGEAALSALEAFAAAPASGPLAAQHAGIARMVSWLSGAGIDIGDPLAQQLLDVLAAVGVLAAPSVAKIKALAQVPAPVSASEVSAALRGE